MLDGTTHRTTSVARTGRLWEFVLLLAAVVLSGILAGLYLASERVSFLVACVLLIAATIVLILSRHPALARLFTRQASNAQAEESGEPGSRRITAFLRPMGGRVAKTAGIAVWLVAWAVITLLFTQVADNADVLGLATFVFIGAGSPFLIYFLFDGAAKRLGDRLRDTE